MKGGGRLLVIDTGSSSMRGALYSGRGELLYLAREVYSPDFTEDGRVEQDAQVWVRSLIRVARACVEASERDGNARSGDARSGEAGGIEAAVLTSARSSVIPLDSSGRPLSRALMWRDKRADSICREFEDDQPMIYSRTGITMNDVISAPKMIWLRRENADVYRRAAKLAGIQDYLIHFLTGVFVTDYSFGSRTGLMNLESRRWDEDLIALFGLDGQKLCDLTEPGAVCGRVRGEAARLTGLSSGLPVISAGGDQQCAALGGGIIGPGRRGVNTGTGAYLLQSSVRPVLDPGRRLFCGAAALPGMYLSESGAASAGGIYDWFAALLTPSREGSGEISRADMYALMNACIEQSPPGSNGVVLVPCGFGVSDARAFLNLRPGTTAGDMGRAVLEGIACELKDNLDLMRRLDTGADTGADTDTNAGGDGEADSSAGGGAGGDAVFSSGGMSGFGVYNQILADVFDCDILHGDSGESTALGAWAAGARSLGFYPDAGSAYKEAVSSAGELRFSPRGEAAERYARLRDFRRSIGALPILERLSLSELE